MFILDKISLLLKEKHISQKELCFKLGLAQQAFTNWKNGNNDSYKKYLPQIADFLGVSVDYLLGKEENPETNAVILGEKKVRLVPVYESVSAGFGTLAVNDIVDYYPCFIESEEEASESLCIVVRGDSMAPKIEDGDLIRVHKQTSIDSGSFAVLLLDGEEALVKKVYYGNNWIELHSVNPLFPVRRFEGAEVLRLQVLGLVKEIIKKV